MEGKKNPEVSIVMTTYNAEKYLDPCLDSILRQDFIEFELIIVDDGSTDHTVSIIESFKDERIRFFKNKKNWPANLNFAYAQATGDYIAHFDADDVMLSIHLPHAVNFLKLNPEYAMVCAGFQAIDEHGAYTDWKYSMLGEIGVEAMLKGNRVAHGSVVMRRGVLDSFPTLHNERYKVAYDYDLWLNMLVHGFRIYCVPAIHYLYRQHPDAISSNAEMTDEETKQITKYYKDYIESLKGKEENPVINDIPEQALRPPYQEQFAALDNDEISTGAIPYMSPDQTVQVTPHVPPSFNHVDGINNFLTVVIPFRNENIRWIEMTIKSINATTDTPLRIIAINDASDNGVCYGCAVRGCGVNVSYMQSNVRLGVAGARMMAIEYVQTPFFIIFDAHMKFYDKGWDTTVVNFMKKHPDDIYTGGTVYLGENAETGELIEPDPVRSVGTLGAKYNLTEYEHMYTAQWLYNNNKIDDSQPVQIPQILGACYAMSKSKFDELGGLKGLKFYGMDEAMLSIKWTLSGGKLWCDNNFRCGHIYRADNPNTESNYGMLYNKLLLNELFSDEETKEKVIIALRPDPEYNRAMRDLEVNAQFIADYKEELKPFLKKDMKYLINLNNKLVKKYETN